MVPGGALRAGGTQWSEIAWGIRLFQGHREGGRAGTVRITAVLEDPELECLKVGLNAMGIKRAKVAEYDSDLKALQAIGEDGSPDLLVFDLDLPGVSGLETVRVLRQKKELEGTPVILVSSEDLVLSAKAATRIQSVLKPVYPDDWSKAIRAVLATPLPKGALSPELPAPSESPIPFQHALRKAERKSYETPCLLSAASSKVKGILRDISITGAKITVQAELRANSMATLILGVPGTVPLKIVQFKARVVRRTLDGYGITFTEMDPDARSLVLAVTRR
jgi:CheY-like chemotaxis protein